MHSSARREVLPTRRPSRSTGRFSPVSSGGLPPRRSSRRRRRAAAPLLAGLLAGGAAAPAGPSDVPGSAAHAGLPAPGRSGDSPAPGFHELVSVGYVLVPVTVRARDGFVSGLEANDFRLAVDGREVEVESFESGASAPISVLVLQDVSGSMAAGGKLELSRRAIERLLDLGRPADLYSLASFGNGRLSVEVAPTADRDALRAVLGRWTAYGTTALHDAVSRLPEWSTVGGATKRAVILLTDGADNASRIGPEAARHTVRRAELPVYVLSLANGAPSSGEPVGGRAGPAAPRDTEILRRLAVQTGGAYASIRDPRQLPRSLAAILAELRHQYVLGFSARGNGDLQPHRIDVETRTGRKRHHVTHRRGYVGGQPRG